MIQRKKGPRYVLIIRDVRDFSRDYFLPEPRAKELFHAGLLAMAQVYNGTWTYIQQDSFAPKFRED